MAWFSDVTSLYLLFLFFIFYFIFTGSDPEIQR